MGDARAQVSICTWLETEYDVYLHYSRGGGVAQAGAGLAAEVCAALEDEGQAQPACVFLDTKALAARQLRDADFRVSAMAHSLLVALFVEPPVHAPPFPATLFSWPCPPIWRSRGCIERILREIRQNDGLETVV